MHRLAQFLRLTDLPMRGTPPSSATCFARQVKPLCMEKALDLVRRVAECLTRHLNCHLLFKIMEEEEVNDRKEAAHDPNAEFNLYVSQALNGPEYGLQP